MAAPLDKIYMIYCPQIYGLLLQGSNETDFYS